MSVDPDSRMFKPHQDQVRAALIVHCRLTSSQIEQIDQAAESCGISFSEGALQIGIVTQNELDKTIDFVKLTADQRETGVIETAIRRRKPSREIVIRPRDVVAASKEVMLAHDPYSPRSELIRALRTELMLLDEAPSKTSVLALVSPCAGEGRSLLAAELAVAFSQLRRRTLLVDADLRNPRQHLLFPAENAWGLAQALALEGAPRYLGVEGLPQLSVMTSGPKAANPLELLSDGRFSRLVSDWHYNFDQIVIDTPPVSDFADALSIATTAGRTLVLSRAAHTPQRSMKEMMRRLISTQSRVMGAVLSNF